MPRRFRRGTYWRLCVRRFRVRRLRSCALEVFTNRADELIDIELPKNLRALRNHVFTAAESHFANDVTAETAVAFHLRFAEPLVGRALMREIQVERSITADVRRLAPVKSGLYINQGPILGALFRVVDSTQRAVCAINRRLLPWLLHRCDQILCVSQGRSISSVLHCRDPRRCRRSAPASLTRIK